MVNWLVVAFSLIDMITPPKNEFSKQSKIYIMRTGSRLKLPGV